MKNSTKTKNSEKKEPLETKGLKKKVGIVTLGCSRNLVDSQKILGNITRKGLLIKEVEDADVAIVNTCAFIEDAKKESIDVILDLIELKKQGKLKKIIVAGCLAERYSQELVQEFKAIDAIIGAQKMLKDGLPDQLSLTPNHFAYLKICESCYNNCSFCVIPSIKGKFSSRSFESIFAEVKKIDSNNTKEINIIGQDITAYGMDIYKEKSLATLLSKISRSVKNVEWLRLLYTYPAHITDELLDIIASDPKICKYIDVPFQHISNSLLTRMNRKFTQKETFELIEKIRTKIPRAIIRTALIVGLPGERDKDFKELLKFVKDVKFEKLGVFIYSREEGVPAHKMPNQVPKKIKEQRYNILMNEQRSISRSIQEKFLGQRLKVLVEQRHEIDREVYIGRSEYDAPDVDGVVYIHGALSDKTRKGTKLQSSPSKNKKIGIGEFVNVQITDTCEYDLIGDII